MKEEQLGTILNEMLDYLQQNSSQKGMMQKILNAMEYELNRRYTSENLDYYNFDGKEVDDMEKHSLQEFLKRHPKVIFEFHTSYALPELYKD